ncbi:MAG: hypothetical protein DRO04_01175 [Candidatus Iainarchaeum archaeon]|mgnify:CR=1 FL=1|uniref:Uncharacterized protein n=1 Tax=Candidatus Iainarchaeum sp. TaxID=3101447 RepID=A0A497JID8_9ARCH|nr:MAG: hypothetical protein DRO04_01175 [Candidatus Diapherotrites archaeon]
MTSHSLNLQTFLTKYLKVLLTKHGLIFGKTQSGKTTFVLRILDYLSHFYSPKRRVFFFNTQFDKRFFRFETVTNFREIKSVLRKSMVIHYYPKSLTDIEDELQMFITFLFGLSKYVDVTLFLDEVQTFSTKTSIPYWLKMALTRGLGFGLNLIGITQRLQNINYNFMSQSFWFILFPVNAFDYPFLKYYGIPIPFWKVSERGFSRNCYFFDYNKLIEILL